MFIRGLVQEKVIKEYPKNWEDAPKMDTYGKKTFATHILVTNQGM